VTAEATDAADDPASSLSRRVRAIARVARDARRELEIFQATRSNAGAAPGDLTPRGAGRFLDEPHPISSARLGSARQLITSIN
jgi:hypothetical protein